MSSIGESEATVPSGSTTVVSRRPFVALIQVCRPHQWVKNSLVFVPLLASHRLMEVDLLSHAAIGFGAFCLAASAIYVLNDILDVRHDRLHPHKRHRAFASGVLHPTIGYFLAGGLLSASLALTSTFLPPLAMILIGIYVAVANLYSLLLKRIAVLDVLTLAGLYTIRLLFGAAAVHLVVSNWLLAFSMFLFLSLAFLKRYAELSLIRELDGSELEGREYAVSDMELVRGLGSVSGYLSVLVLALYIHSSPEAPELYARPTMLWLLGPCLLYWITRLWLLAHRDQLQQDPLLFAVRDRASYVVGLISAAIVIGATI